MIKRAAKQLVEGEHVFNESFEHNKNVLRNMMPSKSTANKVAGYISRLIKMQRLAKIKRKSSSSLEDSSISLTPVGSPDYSNVEAI